MALRYHTNSLLLLCLLSSVTVPTYATRHHPSILTSRARLSSDLSPPRPLITHPPAFDHALLARGIATCGYISGNGAYPITCPAGYTCASTFQYVAQWACCNQIDCVGNYRTCADSVGTGLCDGSLNQLDCSNLYTSVLSCTDPAAPSCFVYARSTHIGDLDTAYSYGCGASGSTVLVLATTTDAGGAAASTSTDYFPTGATIDNTYNAGAAPSSASTPTSASSPNSSSSSPSSSDSGLNTGSMIGIIIAAVGTLGTLVGAYYAWKAVQRRRDPMRGSRAAGQDGGGVYSTVRPYGRGPEVYGAPPPVVYGPPPSYGGRVYPNNWR